MRIILFSAVIMTAPALASPNGRSSTKGSSDLEASSRSENSQAGSIVGSVLLVSTASGAIGSAVGAAAQAEKKAEALRVLAWHLDHHRPSVVHDLVRGEGPVLSGWLTEAGLTRTEQRRFRRTLIQSGAQVDLLGMLQAGPADAAQFADRFGGVLRATFSPARLAEIAGHG